MLEICFHSLSLALFYQFSSNWIYELILTSGVLVLQMDKFRQISTELWPLIVNSFFTISLAFLYQYLQTLHEKV